MWTAGPGAALLFSGLIGLSMGLVGGGGSILAVPILVYVAGLPVPQAVALSLAVVGATAAVGFARMPMKQAVGTSLLIIAANSAAGFRRALRRGRPEPRPRLGVYRRCRGRDVRRSPAGGAHAAGRVEGGVWRLSLAVAGYLLVRNVGPAMQLLTGRGMG